MSQCIGIKRDGKPCTAQAQPSEKYCRRHMKGPKEKTKKRKEKISTGEKLYEVISSMLRDIIRVELSNMFRQ